MALRFSQWRRCKCFLFKLISAHPLFNEESLYLCPLSHLCCVDPVRIAVSIVKTVINVIEHHRTCRLVYVEHRLSG